MGDVRALSLGVRARARAGASGRDGPQDDRAARATSGPGGPWPDPAGFRGRRGLLRSQQVRDRATYENPRQTPDGIPYVLVNGEIVIDNGKHTGQDTRPRAAPIVEASLAHRSEAMVALDFGLTVRPSPHGGTVLEMKHANECILRAAAQHDLTCWVIDHFQFEADPLFECLAFLAYQAGRHPGLRWGTLVLGQGYRNPAVTAKIAATLQFLTDGRFILGLGAGDAEDEHRAYGFPFPSARARVEQLGEAATIIRALWSGGPATFAARTIESTTRIESAGSGATAGADDRRRG